MKKAISVDGSFGKIRHKLTTSINNFLEIEHHRGSKVPIHFHENAHFMFILKGTYRAEIKGRVAYCEPMTLLYHPSGITHADCFVGTGGKLLYISLNISDKSFTENYENVLDAGTLKFADEAIYRLGTRMLVEVRNADELSSLVLEGMSLELLAQVVRKEIKKETMYPNWLKLVRERIDEQFTETITTVELAKTAGVNPLYLSRTFRKYFDCSPSEYLRNRRIKRACQMLTGSKLPLVDIALANGFADQSQFSKTFKKYTDCTPGEFRQLYR